VDAEEHHVLDAFRKKRNIANYERSGAVSATEVAELLEMARSLRERLEAWLKAEHPGLTA
jgi:hypothetical protein